MSGKQLTSVNQLKGIDLAEIELEFAEPSLQLDLGPYFSKFAANMLRGVPPSKVGKDRESFAFSALLVVFVKDLDAMYDSLAASDVELKKTSFFKVMTLLGTFVARWKHVWIEETRSVAVQQEEQKQITMLMEVPETVSSELLYAYAVEFRGRQDEVAKEAFAQLQRDLQALQSEHKPSVVFTLNATAVKKTTDLLFR